MKENQILTCLQIYYQLFNIENKNGKFNSEIDESASCYRLHYKNKTS